MPDTPSGTAAESPKPRRWKKWSLIAAGGVFALFAAGGGYYWWSARAEVALAATAQQPGRSMPRGIVKIDPFLVNLADRDAPRFMRLTVELVLAEESDASRIAGDLVTLARARAAILELLTLQTSGQLSTPEGKTDLKERIAEIVGQIYASTKIVDVLFSDFVIQY